MNINLRLPKISLIFSILRCNVIIGSKIKLIYNCW